MPFQPGHKLSIGNKGGGRKGYTFETSQMERMKTILNKDLKLVEKAYAGKLTEKDLKILDTLQPRVLKYLDKMHASKHAVKDETERPIMII